MSEPRCDGCVMCSECSDKMMKSLVADRVERLKQEIYQMRGYYAITAKIDEAFGPLINKEVKK